MYATENKIIVQASEAYTDPDGTKYPWNFPKGEISLLTKVKETPRPNDSALIVTGYHIDDTYTQVWEARSKTSDELKADYNNVIQKQIESLELLITKRMLREAAIDSLEKGLGENKDKTAKEFIADIDSQIKSLAAQKE